MARLSGRPLLDTRADAALFVDRTSELARLTRAVAEGLNVLVSGTRGIGRTSLLRHVTYRSRAEAPQLESTAVESTDVGSTGADARRTGGVAFLDATSITDSAEFVRRAAQALGVPTADPTMPVSDQLAALAELADSDRKRPRESLQAKALAVDGLAPAVAQVVFGQLRDEIWRVPVAWLVSCSERDEAAFLRPPADAFFDTTLRLGGLADDDMEDLLRRRASREELADDAVEAVVSLASGSPRRAIDLARHLLLAGAEPGSVEAFRDQLLHREQVVDRLGTPARMLLAELERSGGASASDELLLARLAWTRARAAQVLGQLEREGLVEATDEQRGAGRPRRVYRSKAWQPALTGAPARMET